MTARTAFAALAASFFAYLALFYIAPGAEMIDVSVEVGEAMRQELGGSDIGMAVTSAVRALSVGLMVLSLAAVEWRELRGAYQASEARRAEAGGAS